MEAADSATEPLMSSGDATLIELHTTLLDALAADSAYWSAVAGAFAGEVSEEVANRLGVEADRAVERFNAAYAAAAGTTP
jgi:hypothetical protein